MVIVIVCTSYRVYPRVCGGTISSRDWSSASRGLSPRVRGNLEMASIDSGLRRSIPACAGEPCAVTPYWPELAVYPRVCGGTAWHSPL